MELLQKLIPLKQNIQNYWSANHIKEQELPSDLKFLQSQISEDRYQMESLSWKNELFRFARLTYLTSNKRIEMLNFTIYPHYHFDIPIFATDFVILGSQLRIGVIDAMPLFPEDTHYYKTYVEPFGQLFEESLKIGIEYERKLDWSFKYLSPFACLTSSISSNELQPLFHLWNSYFELYLSLAKNAVKVSPEQETLIKDWHFRYNMEHLEVENKRNPLVHYFGEETGTRYNSAFLFSNAH